jgi:hypothetical protein
VALRHALGGKGKTAHDVSSFSASLRRPQMNV